MFKKKSKIRKVAKLELSISICPLKNMRLFLITNLQL